MSGRGLIPCCGVLAWALLPEAAAACAVCFSGTPETRAAFLLTTLLLSALPLVMVGGIVCWIWRRSRALSEPSPQRSPVRPARAAPPASAGA